VNDFAEVDAIVSLACDRLANGDDTPRRIIEDAMADTVRLCQRVIKDQIEQQAKREVAWKGRSW